MALKSPLTEEQVRVGQKEQYEAAQREVAVGQQRQSQWRAEREERFRKVQQTIPTTQDGQPTPNTSRGSACSLSDDMHPLLQMLLGFLAQITILALMGAFFMFCLYFLRENLGAIVGIVGIVAFLIWLSRNYRGPTDGSSYGYNS